MLTVFGGESGDRFLRTHRGEERFPGMTITLALFSDSWKDCREIITKVRVTELIMSSGNVFNEGVEFCKENGASDPTTVLRPVEEGHDVERVTETM